MVSAYPVPLDLAGESYLSLVGQTLTALPIDGSHLGALLSLSPTAISSAAGTLTIDMSGVEGQKNFTWDVTENATGTPANFVEGATAFILASNTSGGDLDLTPSTGTGSNVYLWGSLTSPVTIANNGKALFQVTLIGGIYVWFHSELTLHT